MRAEKTIDECSTITPKRGNGKVRCEVWKGEFGNVVRYNFAYINHAIYSKDNGRVLGYDNAHGIHHRHFMGKSEAISYHGFGQVKARFNRDLGKLLKGATG